MCVYSFFSDNIADGQFTVELVAFAGFHASSSAFKHWFYA
jgi:hypothetical protein